MRGVLRLVASICTTVFGIAFLMDVVGLLYNYNYKFHRFPPYMAGYIRLTVWFAIGFICSLISYLYLVHKMRPATK